VYALILLQGFDKITLKSRRKTYNCRNFLPNPRDSMKNPYLSRYSTTIAKKQASREVTSLPSTNRQVKASKSTRDKIERISQVGRKFQPRVM
jgi:hypothetical protein